MAKRTPRERMDEYKFLCWLAGEVPSARVIRDYLREERSKE